MIACGVRSFLSFRVSFRLAWLYCSNHFLLHAFGVCSYHLLPFAVRSFLHLLSGQMNSSLEMTISWLGMINSWLGMMISRLGMTLFVR